MPQFGYDLLRSLEPLRSLFAAGVITGGGSDPMQNIGDLERTKVLQTWIDGRQVHGTSLN